MTESTSVTQQIPRIENSETTSYAPYAQLVKMLVPSSGCIAIHDTAGDLIWCSDGYERPDLRELVDELKTAELEPVRQHTGRITQTSTGVTAYSSALAGDDGTPLGFVVIQLATAQGGAKSGSMVPSLLRPVLECLAARISLETTARAVTPAPKNDDLELFLALDEETSAEPGALKRLIEHCVENMHCISGAILVPEKNLSVIANRSETSTEEAAQLLDRTQKHLLAWAQLNNRPMVINRIGPDAGIAPYKILSCPIRDPHDRVTGLMALFRTGDAPNFEVRDVRVLEYIGRKAIGLLNSQHDPLTGLMNRLIFERQVRSVIETDPEPGAAGRAMLYIDVDRLQFINDAFGFHAGDEVIERVAQLIRERVGREGIASRLGGDRFAIFMTACGEEQARAVATELLTAISSLGYMNGADAVPVSISIGLAMPGPAQRDFGHLIAAAELACKRAQQQGRNRLDIYAYGEATSPGHEGELLAAAALKQALQSNDFRLQAQPIVDLYNDPGKVLGYEVLVRMRDTSGALISPEKFIVAAERYGLMPALDKWVLTATVKALRAHKDQLRELPLGIAVNVSAQSLMNSDFAALVLAELTASGLPPELFCFELKESAAVNQLAAAEKFIKTVTEIGCHISLDDFGSGLTSLSHLKRLKVSYLKIDGSLIRRVIDDIHAESLVRGLAKAAQTLGVLTVAEHVESAALAEKLQQLEVDLAQGYHYGRPMPLIRAIANVGVAAPAVSTA